MVDLESRLSLETDEVAVRELVEEAGARIEADSEEPGLYWLTMHPKSNPEQTFVARIAWTRYPHSPPSIMFAEGIGGRTDLSSVWPVIPGYRPGTDICQPFTAEGFAVHPDWVNGPDAWPVTGNPFLWIVSILLHDIAERYQGRSG